MILYSPFIITSRLMAGVKVGEAYLSIGYGRYTSEGRMQYDVWIDLPDGSEHHVTDLRSGCQGGTLQEGMASLLCFLSAAGEAKNYRERSDRPDDEDSNEHLFVPAVTAWAADNTDELTCLEMEIEESETALIEE